MTLSAFAAERRRLQHGARSAPAAIDLYLLLAGRSAANPPAAFATVDQWVRRTDRRTDAGPLNPAPHTMQASSIKDCLLSDCRKMNIRNAQDYSLHRFHLKPRPR